MMLFPHQVDICVTICLATDSTTFFFSALMQTLVELFLDIDTWSSRYISVSRDMAAQITHKVHEIQVKEIRQSVYCICRLFACSSMIHILTLFDLELVQKHCSDFIASIKFALAALENASPIDHWPQFNGTNPDGYQHVLSTSSISRSPIPDLPVFKPFFLPVPFVPNWVLTVNLDSEW